MQERKGVKREFRETSAQLYRTFEDAVANASRQDIIPTQFVREDGSLGGIATFALQAAVDAEQAAVRLADGSVLSRAGPEGVTQFIEQLKGLPPLITPKQYRQIMQDLSDLIGANIKDGFDFFLAKVEVAD